MVNPCGLKLFLLLYSLIVEVNCQVGVLNLLGLQFTRPILCEGSSINDVKVLGGEGVKDFGTTVLKP